MKGKDLEIPLGVLSTKDRRILKELFDNGRTPFSSIAKKVGLSKEVVNYRVKKLIDDFLEVVTYIERYNRTAEERFVFIITCSASPEIEEYAKKKEVEIIWSYEV